MVANLFEPVYGDNYLCGFEFSVTGLKDAFAVHHDIYMYVSHARTQLLSHYHSNSLTLSLLYIYVPHYYGC